MAAKASDYLSQGFLSKESRNASQIRGFIGGILLMVLQRKEAKSSIRLGLEGPESELRLSKNDTTRMRGLFFLLGISNR